MYNYNYFSFIFSWIYLIELGVRIVPYLIGITPSFVLRTSSGAQQTKHMGEIEIRLATSKCPYACTVSLLPWIFLFFPPQGWGVGLYLEMLEVITGSALKNYSREYKDAEDLIQVNCMQGQCPYNCAILLAPWILLLTKSNLSNSCYFLKHYILVMAVVLENAFFAPVNFQNCIYHGRSSNTPLLL